MNFYSEDLYAIILSRLPLKSIISFKLVCKRWKSLLESPFFRDLFLSQHPNLHYSSSSWSIMCRGCETETIAHFGSDNWNLKRSLDSYISSFLTLEFPNRQGRVVAYTDVGLILIHLVTNQSFYVANPVSRQCGIQIFPNLSSRFWILGIATRIEDGVVLDYKIVLLKTNFSFLIYSSETGLWSIENACFPFSFISQEFNNPISLNGNLHWVAHNLEYQDFVVTMDFFGSGTVSDRCSVTPFPDLEKVTRFRRACTTSQGHLMYVNIVSEHKYDGTLVDKLCVWRLESEGWDLASEISPDFIMNGFDYIPLGLDPCDAKRVYFWRGNLRHQSLFSINLENGEFVVEKESEAIDREYILESQFATFVLPEWLHPFPRV